MTRTWQRFVAGLLAALCLASAIPAKAQIGGGPDLINSITLYGVGAPQVVLNAVGSNYGQLFNPSGSRSTGVWALGFGTSNSANGTEVLTWNTSNQVEINHGTVGASASNSIASAGSSTLSASPLSLFQVNSLINANGDIYYYIAYRSNGWLELKYASAAVPTVNSAVGCGASPSAAAGTDQAGDITVGSSMGGICGIKFTSQPTNIPHCVCNDTTTPLAGCSIKSLSTSGFTMQNAPVGGETDFQTSDRLDWLCLAHG